MPIRDSSWFCSKLRPAASTEDGKGCGHAAEMAKLAAELHRQELSHDRAHRCRGNRLRPRGIQASFGRRPSEEIQQRIGASEGARQAVRADGDGPRCRARRRRDQLALEWLEKNELGRRYTRPSFSSWLELAEKVDPNNEHGQVEAFFLAELRERLHEVRKTIRADSRRHPAARRLEEGGPQVQGREFRRRGLSECG